MTDMQQPGSGPTVPISEEAAEIVTRALRQASELRRQKRDADALPLIAKVLDLVPDHGGALLMAGEIHTRRGDPQLALKLLDRAIAVAPDSAAAHSARAGALFRTSRLDEAMAAYRRAIELAPDRGMLFRRLANALYFSGDHGAAVEHYRRAIELNPDDHASHNNLAGVLLDRGDAAAACEHLVEACRLAPDTSGYRSSLGAALLLAGKPEQALIELDAALAAQPFESQALVYRAQALGRLGLHDDLRRLVDLQRFIWIEDCEPPAGYDSMDDFAGALARYIVGHSTLVAERAGKTTRGGSQTGSLLEGDAGPVDELMHMVEAAARKYVEALPRDETHPFLGGHPESMNLDAWGTLLHAGGHQQSHHHPAGWISGVFYVEMPSGQASGEDGWIEFGRPRDAEHGEFETRMIEPKVGRLVLFPSYFWHRTVPFSSGGRRISIAFDFRPN